MEILRPKRNWWHPPRTTDMGNMKRIFNIYLLISLALAHVMISHASSKHHVAGNGKSHFEEIMNLYNEYLRFLTKNTIFFLTWHLFSSKQ